MRRRTIIGLAGAFLLTSCAYVPPMAAPGEPGFWLGLFHGFIALFTMIFSFFTDIEMYAVPNKGPLYDLGFVIGIMIFAGTGGHQARGR